MVTTARVVGHGQLIGQRLHLDLHHIGAGAVDVDGDAKRIFRRHFAPRHQLAVPAYTDHGIARAAALADLRLDQLCAPDDAVSRRLDQVDLAIALVGCPVIRACSGASNPSSFTVAGMSWITPSVIMIAPAIRSGGTSARALPSAVKSSVPASPALSSNLDDTRLRCCATRQAAARSAQARRSVMSGRAPRSLRGRAVDDYGDHCHRPVSRSSLTKAGLASARTSTASAAARRIAGAPRTTSAASPAIAASAIATMSKYLRNQRGETQAHGARFLNCPERSSRAGTCT